MAGDTDYFYDDYIIYKQLYDKEYRYMLKAIRSKHKIKIKVEVIDISVDNNPLKIAALYFKLGPQQYCIAYYPSVNYWCLHQQVDKDDYDSLCELSFDQIAEKVHSLIEESSSKEEQ